MNAGKYIFAQLVEVLPHRIFDGIVKKYDGDKYVKHFTCWNQLLVMMFGQLSNRDSMRDLIFTINAHSKKLYHLGMGKSVTRSNLGKANERRDSKIFEEFAYHMIEMARVRRRSKDFEIDGQVYAFDSTTIDLCLNVFWWAKFRKNKGGIKVHTLYDVNTSIPSFIHITPARVHDVKAMDEIPYETDSYYVFDRGYYDLKRLKRINDIGAYFVIRPKKATRYIPKEVNDTNHNANGILCDDIVEFDTPVANRRYEGQIRRVIYYAADLNKTFVYLTNNFDITAETVALLYKKRWEVELFFKWVKQHLKIKSFWGCTENAVKIQIYSAIIAYCMVAIVEHDLQLNKSTYEVLRIFSVSLLDKTPIKTLFTDDVVCEKEDLQLYLNFF